MIDNQFIFQIHELALENPDQELCGTQQFPKELCGIILEGKLIQSVNVAEDPRLNFELDKKTLNRVLRAQKKGLRPIIWHTHCNDNSDFSVPDIKCSRSWKLPFYLYHPASGISRFYDPLVIQPYLERDFHWAYQNCWDLCREFYEKEFGIVLSYFYLDRPDEFNDLGFTKFLENWQTQGFISIDKEGDLQRGDVILMSMKGGLPNHCGVLFSSEENTFLHQMSDAYSRLSNFCQGYKNLTHSIYRHKNLIKNE